MSRGTATEHDALKGLRQLATATDGPATIRPILVGESDRAAARLLLHVVEEILPEDATVGDAEDVLLDAVWWLRTWASNAKAEKKS